ncbi:MAG: hypothetical protein ACI93R_003997 [Flavobacteriales bacterium]|jgi:hypothetical protein
MAESNDTLESRSAQEKFPNPDLHPHHLTVLETVIEQHAKTRSVGITYAPVQLEPCIVLRGKWLRDAGFDIGQKITVLSGANELYIAHSSTSEAPSSEL